MNQNDLAILAKFGARVFDAFFGDGSDIGDLDRFDLQEIAVDSGLLTEHVIETDQGCGEGCNCIGNGAGAGDSCYRPTVKRDVSRRIK